MWGWPLWAVSPGAARLGFLILAGLLPFESDLRSIGQPRADVLTRPQLTFRLLRFQYKYPGTPISTIAVPQNAWVGRVMIVFSVQAVPIST